MSPDSNEWEQYYQKSFTAAPMSGGGIISSDAAVVTDQSFVSSTSPTNGGQLTPTGSVAKPIRRRSRVSKKTPITLLNANANNFRALVQQFTGCAAASSPISFGNQKGPINLSFGANGATTSSVGMAPYGNHNYTYNQQQQQLQRLAQVQQEQQRRQPLHQVNQQEEQQRMYSFDNNNVSGSDHVFHYSSNLSSSGYNNPMASGMEIGDGFEVMDQEDISLHELLD